jgi:2-haloacid dehalogenase
MAEEALVFDAYGTLFDVHSVAARCEACWPGKGAQVSQLWRAKQLEYTWQRSLMQRYAPFSSVAQMEGLMGEYLALKLFPEVESTLRGLHGTRTAILSNGSPDMLDPLVQQSGLRFDAVISVDELKVYKPAPQVYELAVRKLRTRDIGFVSSNCWDAIGAKSYGFRVYWVNRAHAPLDRLGFKPDRVLNSLNEILQ